MNILFLTSAAPEKSGFFTTEKRPPVGLGYLMSVLKNAGHNIFFSDEYLKPSNILESDFLPRNMINCIGIYSNTVCYDSTLEMLNKIQVMRKMKKWSGKILVGGPHTSVGWGEIPDYVDGIVIGEGEVSLPKILSGEITDRVVFGEKLEDLDSLPFPAWEEFVYRSYDWSHPWHASAYPLYPLVTSRGCPFDCTFCSVKAIWGKSYRYMSPERVVEEIQYLIRYYGARGIYFREDNFTLNKKRTIDICELLLKKGINIDWFCETRVDQLDDVEYQKLLFDAGCRVFYIGVESGSPKMLEFMKKGETREQFIRAIEISKQVGIKTYASFVVGLPHETEFDIEQTNSLIEIAKPDFVGRNVFVGIPGSELYEYIRDNKLYEYEDNKHILYPIGYKNNVRKYYGDAKQLDIYELPRLDSKIKTALYKIFS